MKETSRKNIRIKLILPKHFQEDLTNCEIKYESGERSSYLIKEIISLYKVL